MTLFLLLMVPCLVAILCASVAVGGKAGFGLALVMLTLQGLTIVAYTNYKATVSVSDAIMYGCEVVDVSETSGHTDDYIAILRSYGYKGIAGDGREALYSPGC